MKHINLLELQITELFRAYLNDPSSLFPSMAPGTLAPGTLAPGTSPSVVSGQQIGLLGGPLYTLLKIRSARAAADELSVTLNTTVDAVFWLEDNDHDAAEAATVKMPKEGGGIEKVMVWDGEHARIPVSRRSFTEHEIGMLGNVIDNIGGRYVDDVQATLRNAYKEGRLWSETFLDLLEPYTTAWNIKVVKGSDVIASGAHAWLVERDLKENGELERIIADTTQRLVAKGFHAQATVPDSLFFFHDEEGRHKMMREGANYRVGDKVMEKNQLLEILHLTPQVFSPSVLARPLVQDKVASTVATILGAAELAYHAQITDLYTHLGMQQPMCLARHTASVLDPRTERLLEKSGKDVKWFFRHWEEVESETVTALAVEMAVPKSDSFNTEEAIAPFRDAAQRIDPTLVKTAEAAAASIRATIEALEGKLRAAVKRTGIQVVERVRTIWWNVYPDAVLSERVFPLAHWMAHIGPDALRIIVERICSQERNSLTVIGSSDIESKDTHAE